MMKILLLLGMYFFCHIKVTRPIGFERYIIKIPPEIYKRLLYNTCRFMCFGVIDNNTSSYSVPVGTSVDLSSGEYYFYSGTAINDVGAYLIGYYMLKDI